MEEEGVPQPEDVTGLRSDLDDRERRLKAVSKAYAELQEEWASFRKRSEAAAAFRQEQLVFQIVGAFLEPLENLKRSIDAGAGDAPALLEGCRIVHGQFLAELTRLGLQAVPGVGAPFDPVVHEAVAEVPVDDPAADGTVMAVVSEGWTMGKRTVRAGRVVTGRHGPQAEG